MTPILGPEIKLVLLDHDDTQVGTIAAKWAAHKHVAITFYGKTLSDEQIRKVWGIPLRQLVSSLYGDDDVERALARYMPTSPDFPKQLLEGTILTLEQVKQSGKLLGVVSASLRKSLEYDWETLGIDGLGLFDFIQTEEDTQHHKPNRRVFDPAIRWAAERGIRPSEMLYVGDSLLDKEAAIGAGLRFLGVATGLVSVSEFREAGAQAIPSLADLVSASVR